MSFNVALDNPLTTWAAVLNPATGTTTLLSTQADPDGEGTRAVAVTTGRKNVGTAGTATTVLVTFPFENIVDVGNNSRRALLEKLLAF